MENLKVKVNSESESKEAQELFFELGASWCFGCHINDNLPHDRSFILHNFGSQLFWAHTYESKNYDDAKEITISELREMVSQDQDGPFITPECTLNDQYAEIEQVRQQTIEQTLAERGSRYGDYSDVASTTQQLMAIIECGASYEHLNAEQKTSLFMICNKIARAVNGDPNYIENWHDIAGYSTLIESSLMTTEGATNSKIVAQRVVNGVMEDIKEI